MLNRIENAFSILLERSTIISRKVKTFVSDAWSWRLSKDRHSPLSEGRFGSHCVSLRD